MEKVRRRAVVARTGRMGIEVVVVVVVVVG
jgi:hypothetical protein